ENATDDKSDKTPKDIARGQVHPFQEKQTSNVERPTPTTQSQNQIAALDIELCGLSVRRFLHLLSLSHASHPPSRTKTFFNCASSRSRFATSRLALQLCAL